MSETEPLFSGYFLELLPEKHDGHNVIKVACFKSGSVYRKILELTTDNECNYQYGDIVRFWPLGPMKNKVVVKFKNDPDVSYERATSLPNKIIYTMKDFQVGQEDLIKLHQYKHHDLGQMNIEHHPMSPGTYHSLVFEVILDNAEDSFSLKVHSNQLQPHFQQRQVSVREQFEQKTTMYPDIIKIEKEHNTIVESLNWKEIGFLKLKKVDEKDLIGGIRAIFKIMSEDQQKLELFGNRKDAYPIVIIKQCEIDGRHEDDDDNRFEGTLFERKNDLGQIKRSECVVQLKNDDQKRFYARFQPGDVYRFDALPLMKTLNFWQEGKQNENEIYRLTLEETSNPDPLKLQDVIDSAMRDPLELKNLSDKNTPKNNLNDSQLAAIKMALNDQRPLVCIQGPPGTGKSHTLSMLLFRVLKMKQQAVVLTPTKEALKNLRQMTQNLCDRREKELKLHPYSFMDIKTYHALINDTEEAREAVYHFAEMKALCQRGEMTEDDMWEERENRRKTIKAKVGAEILQHVRIVFATIESSFCATVMKNKSFDPSYCVIDEAAQVMESQMWPAVHKMKKIVMAGDPKQLPALVLTEEARQFGLNQSVMERIISKKEHFSWIMLEEQYRSHKEITDWSNGCFYECKLINNTDLENVLMTDLKPKPTGYEHLYQPKVFIDTSLVTDRIKRVATYEQKGERDISYVNEGEAQYALEHYKNLLSMSIEPNTIAILTPYKGQVELFKVKLKQLNEKFLEEGKDYDCMKTHIGTVDSVQGQEYDVVIFSFVRSNPQKKLGFVKDTRRINVAITRAKRHIMLIGNGFMLYHSHEEPIRRLFEQCKSNKRRFHPENLYKRPGNVPDTVTNNFGLNFADFMAYSKDEDMVNWCKEYNDRRNDPKFLLERRKKEYRKECEKLNSYIAQACHNST